MAEIEKALEFNAWAQRRQHFRLCICENERVRLTLIDVRFVVKTPVLVTRGLSAELCSVM